MEPDAAALAAVGEAPLDEPELLQPGGDLAERLLGLRRPSRDLGDGDPGPRVDVLEQAETSERERTVGQCTLAELDEIDRDPSGSFWAETALLRALDEVEEVARRVDRDPSRQVQ